MEKLKFILFSIVFLGVLGLLGFWAVKTIEPGDTHVYAQRIKGLESENKDLQKQVEEWLN